MGPSLRPIRQPLAPSPQKTVYISLGTVNNQNLPFYRSCLTALGETPYRVVMAVGRESMRHALGPLPANVQAEAMVDQIGVLAAADVFLTHCGMNSVSEALFFDVPLVCCPQTQEQRGVANRVRALGAGLLLPDDSPQAIAQAIGIALSDPSYRAHAATIAQSFMLVVTMPLGGITSGTQAVLAYNFGAGKTDRVKNAQKYIFSLAAAYTALLFVRARTIGGLFVRLFTADPVVAAEALRAIRIFTLAIIPLAFQYEIVDGFTGLGQVQVALPLSFFRKGLYFVSLFLLPAMFGAEAAFFAEPVSDIAGPVVSAIVYIVSMKGILAKAGEN